MQVIKIIILYLRKRSSAGMSVRLTRERSRVRAPSFPLPFTNLPKSAPDGADFCCTSEELRLVLTVAMSKMYVDAAASARKCQPLVHTSNLDL